MSMKFRQKCVANPRRSAQQWAPLLMVLLSPLALAQVDESSGRHGVLHLSGSMTESACQLDMGSLDQSIDLGNIGTHQLRAVGDQAEPVRVQLRLQDCVRGASSRQDTLGNLTWSASMPSLSVSFTGAQDTINPELVQAVGVGGIGLRVLDKDQRDARVGQAGQPFLLTPGNNQLTYYIAAERTAAPLQVGRYSALVTVGLSYE